MAPFRIPSPELNAEALDTKLALLQRQRNIQFEYTEDNFEHVKNIEHVKKFSTQKN